MSEGANKKNRYKDTLLLPTTDFPMRASLVEREPQRLEKWESGNLYQRITERRKNEGAPKFILHDGPPFANGDVHMGTALNKVLKDLVVKSRTMAGAYAPYIPGWDCHGLPIEFKVVQQARELTPVEVRRRSEEYARKFIDIQRKSFRRLGVFGDWENPYLTLAPEYEADIVRVFAKLVERGLVYSSLKPVQWSYGAQTALAEAEVEYEDVTDTAIFVKFDINAGPLAGESSLVIWTTTPWTLPANLGIALNKDFDYVRGTFSHAEDGREADLVIAKALLEAFAAKTGFALVGEGTAMKGSEFEGATARHPFLDRDSKVIFGSFVTAETGTGAVHIAPGHGNDDYLAGRENGLAVLSPVDDLGNYTEEAGLPDLVGKHVFQCNEPIIEMLATSGHLLGRERYRHSYPHCWRSKTPIIFRAVSQFFVRIDDLRPTALAEIDKVEWLPHWGRNRIYGTVESRPDWCISRQRTWGVPLPVFYTPEGDEMLDPELIRKVGTLIEEGGTNLWFEKDDAWWNEKLGLPVASTRCQDTLDVWIDSGSSHVAVIDRRPELECPADLYLEATDQHRGWFQSSLMLSVGYRGHAPYKTVMTHGFVVRQLSNKEREARKKAGLSDQKTKKVSKSDEKKGKPMDAAYFYDKYGADILRLWVSSVDWQNEVPFGEELFDQTADTYRRIRNTLRILLGNLSGFDPANAVAPADLTMIDRWILERMNAVVTECLTAYDKYEFRRVFNELNQFCAVDLSSLYVDITKDRMYCDAEGGIRRRSAQTAMHQVFESLTRLLAPILVYTADEAWELSGHADSVHIEDFPKPDPAFAVAVATPKVTALLELRCSIQQEIEKARQAKTIGSNLEAHVEVTLAKGHPVADVGEDIETLSEFLIVSDLTIIAGNGEETKVTVSHSDYGKCERCWRFLPGVGQHAEHDTLCDRCAEVVS
ncbi:MAG: isoleucine--tRNA ligase [Verrucomicrobiae bacterium]|nr:isoleucine--tRNA ligase [Verrucomicrobiae bacterium]